MNLASYAVDIVKMDIILGFLPPNIITVLDLIMYYRIERQPLTIEGLSTIVESNPGIGSMHFSILF